MYSFSFQHNQSITGSTILVPGFTVELAGSQLFPLFWCFLVFSYNRTGLVADSRFLKP